MRYKEKGKNIRSGSAAQKKKEMPLFPKLLYLDRSLVRRRLINTFF